MRSAGSAAESVVGVYIICLSGGNVCVHDIVECLCVSMCEGACARGRVN